MSSRVMAAVLYGALVCLAPACSSDEEPGTDDPGTQDQVPLFPDGGDNGGPPDTQAVAPVSVPPFGTDAPLISTYLQRLADNCGGEVCVDIAYEVDPEGAEVNPDACFVFGGSPTETIVPGETLTLQVNCPQQPEPEVDGGEVPSEDGGGGE